MPRYSLFPMFRSIFKDTIIDVEEIIPLLESEIKQNNSENFAQVFETMKKLKDLNLSMNF